MLLPKTLALFPDLPPESSTTPSLESSQLSQCSPSCHDGIILYQKPLQNIEKEKKRKDYAFRRQFNEKPSIIPGSLGVEERTKGTFRLVTRLSSELSNQGLSRCLSNSLAHPVKDLGKGNPVEANNSAKAGKDVARERKHGFVDCCEQRPKDYHACWGQDVCQGAAERLGGVRKKLRHCLQVTNLQTISILSSCLVWWEL